MASDDAPPSRTSLAKIWPPTVTAASSAGHQTTTPLHAIRAKCIDCSAGQLSEVRLCEAISCAIWPFRAGTHPYVQRRKNGFPKGDFSDGEPFGDESQPESGSVVGD